MRKRSRLGVAILACALAAPRAWAGEPPPRGAPPQDPPGTYAGRDAAWWVGELRGAGTQRAAYEALKVIGAPAIPAIAAVLNHADPALRGSALGLLKEINGDLKPARDALAEALALSADGQRDQALLELVSRLGREGAPLAAQIVIRLASTLPYVRGRALATLEQTGGEAAVIVPPLRILLHDADDATVTTALRVLTRLGVGAAPAIPDAVTILGAGDLRAPSSAGTYRRGRPRDPQAGAIALLAAVGRVGTDAHAALAALARSDDAGLAMTAAQALATIALVEPAAADRLVEMLADSKAASLRAAIDALSRLRPLPPTVLESLVRLLGGEAVDVAYQAGLLLLQADADPETYMVTLLAAMRRDPRASRLQEIFGQASERSPEAFVRAIPADLEAPGPLLAQALQRLAARIARSPAQAVALDRLVGWLAKGTSEQELRATVIEPLVSIAGDGADLARRLEPLLTDADAIRSRLAGQVLGRLPGARAVLRAWLREANVAHHRIAILALRGSREELTAEDSAALLALLSDADAPTRADAAALLLDVRAGMHPAFARPEAERLLLQRVLVELLASPLPERRVLAVMTLGRLNLPCPDAVEPLIRQLADDAQGLDPEAVAGALAGVVGSDTRALRARLVAVLDPAGPEVLRAGAAVGLTTLHEESDAVEAALPALLSAGPWPARWRALIAVRLLGARGTAFEAAVRDLVAYPNYTVAGEACRALSIVAPKSDLARRAIAALAADRSNAWRGLAVAPLAAFGGAAAQDLLALRGDVELRAQVLVALRELGPLAHDALPTLEDDLRKTPGDAALRDLVEALRR